MDESAFVALADTTLRDLESAIADAAEHLGLDIDIEPQEGGILKLEFEDRSQIVINRHLSAREIWVASRAGGFHFRFEQGHWLNTRDGSELWTALDQLLSLQAGKPFRLKP